MRLEGKRGGSTVGTTVDSTMGCCLGAGTVAVAVVVRKELVILARETEIWYSREFEVTGWLE